MPRTPRIEVSCNRYGKQRDIFTECRVRYSEDSDSIRIFFKDSFNPIYIPKTSAAYHSLKRVFNLDEEGKK